jgi:hypothetical protein
VICSCSVSRCIVCWSVGLSRVVVGVGVVAVHIKERNSVSSASDK